LKGHDIKQLVVAEDHACVVANSAPYCWGQNEAGQALPKPSPNVIELPTLVPGKLAKEIGVAYQRTCATKIDGYVDCWGSDTRAPVVQVNEPEPFNEMRGPVGGAFQFCALDVQASAWCWGGNPLRWRGTTEERAARITLLGGRALTGLEQIDGGSHQVCATRGREVYCWGAVEFDAPSSSCDPDSGEPPETCGFATRRHELPAP
jgi:hypothetical protein